MVLGIEYRTTERYLGNPVYKKMDSDGVIWWSTDQSTWKCEAERVGAYSKTETDVLLQKKADKDRVVNPNLLDNWYFANPVNQRGQTTYTTSSDEYTIDRWMKSAGTLSIEDGYISASLTNWSAIIQNIEPNLFKALAGKTLTFSVLHNDGQLKKTTFTPDSNYTNTDIWNGLGGEYGTMIYRWSDGHPNLVYANSQNSELVAIKLELGDNQTLAHQDADGNWVLNEIPDYGEQLARCQRYFQTFATESLRPTNALDFRPVMRATPALSTITVGGKTLYTASADL